MHLLTWGQYAYDSMIYFHVQRLSGGFVLTSMVGIVGFIIFSIKMDPVTGVIFLLYLVVIAMYLNVLGMSLPSKASLHRK